MKKINIGSRLRMAASFIDQGRTVCDVGCDHGKLTVYLLQSQKADRVIATDIGEKPLQKAVDAVSRRGLADKVSFLCTDGLSRVEDLCDTDEISHVVIAGMGGVTMSEIIRKTDFLKNSPVRLVLLPAQRGHYLRAFLWSNGFEIIREEAVSENGKYYTCMLVKYTGLTNGHSLTEVYCGRAIKEKSAEATGYLKMVRVRLEKMLPAAQNGVGEYPLTDIQRVISDIDRRISQ